MSSWLEIGLTNGVLATGLALLAVLAGRLSRPAVAHVLWALVLLKLLTPPLFQLRVVPPVPAGVEAISETTSATRPVSALAAPSPRVEIPEVEAALFRPTPPEAAWGWPSLSTFAAFGWAGGALALALLAGVRLARFRRLVRRARPTDPTLDRRIAALSARLGLARSPEARLVDAPLPPLVFALCGRPRIYLPCRLVERLAPASLDAVLVHELAHVKRRDHWVRGLEVIAGTLFWWLPVTWWARRSLHLAEEMCCDEWVLKTLPGSHRAYALGLLETLEMTASRPAASLPALASGIAVSRRAGSASPTFETLEKRLTMIMKPRFASDHPALRYLLAGAALALLLIFPTWAQGADEEEADRGEARLELEALEAAGERESADRLRQEVRSLEQRAVLERERAELERQYHEKARPMELKARQMMLEAESLRARGDQEKAEEVMRRAEDLQAELEEHQLAATAKELELEKRYRAAELEALESERRQLESTGNLAESERLARHADRLRAESELLEREHGLRLQRQELEVEQQRVRRELHQREAEELATLRAREQELESQYRDMERERVRHQVEAELAHLHTELPLRLVELRRMLETVDDDGELSEKLDQLETALESALDRDDAD